MIYSKDVENNGMRLSELNRYIKDHCNTINFVSYEHAIDNGYFIVISRLHPPPNSGGHATLVVGYEPGGNLITMDPDTGQETIIHKSQVQGHSLPFSPK